MYSWNKMKSKPFVSSFHQEYGISRVAPWQWQPWWAVLHSDEMQLGQWVIFWSDGSRWVHFSPGGKLFGQQAHEYENSILWLPTEQVKSGVVFSALSLVAWIKRWLIFMNIQSHPLNFDWKKGHVRFEHFEENRYGSSNANSVLHRYGSSIYASCLPVPRSDAPKIRRWGE